MVTKRDPRLTLSQAPVQTQEQTHTPEEYNELLERLHLLEEQVKTSQTQSLPRSPGFRVSPKGGVSIYGLHANFPVTMYADQLKRLFEPENQKRLFEFIEANRDVLNFVDDSPEVIREKAAKRAKAGIVAKPPRGYRIETASNVKVA
jgi:hypothetical protein